MKNIDKIIDNVKSSQLPEFPFSDAQVRTVLEDVDSAKILKNSILKGVITMTIISSLIMSIIVSLLYFSSITNNSSVSENSKQAIHKNSTNTVKSDMTFTDNRTISKQQIKSAYINNNNSGFNKTNNSNNVNNLSDISYNNKDESDQDTEKTIKTKTETSNYSDNQQPENRQNLNNQENKIPENKILENKIPENKIPENKIPENKILENKIPENKILENKILENSNNLNPNTNISSKEKNNIFDITEQGTKESNKDTVEILVLNEKELENIFILKTDCGYLGIVEETYPINQSQEQMDEIKALHYPKKGHKHSIYLYNNYDITYCKALEYKGWDLSKSEGVFPVNSMLLKIDSSNSYISRSIRRGGIGPIEFDYKIVNSTFFEKISQIFLKLKNQEIKNSIKVVYNKKECPEQKSLVQIYLQSKSNDGISHIMLTYPASKNLISLLPKRYNLHESESTFDGLGADLNSIDFKNEMSKALLNQKDYCDKAKKQNDEMESKFESLRTNLKSIAGIERLELSNDEAAQIGLIFNNETISTTTEDYLDLSVMPDKVQSYIKNDLGYNFNGYALLRAKVNVDRTFSSNTDFKIDPIKYSGWDIKSWSYFSPVCISMNKKNKGNNLFNSQTFQSPWLIKDTNSAYIQSNDLLGQDSTGKFVSKISKLIPVHISDFKINEQGDTLTNNIDFWYVANREFVMKLPDRYRNPILKELDLIKSIENGTLPVEDACEILKGATSYFGICSSGNSEINQIKVFPNPVTESAATVTFNLTNDKKLKIELFSSDGKFSGLIKDFEEYKSGKNTIKIDLSKMGNGVFLLSLTDEENNRATVKLIK